MRRSIDLEDIPFLVSIIMMGLLAILIPTYIPFSIILFILASITEIKSRKYLEIEAFKYVKFSTLFLLVGISIANAYGPATISNKMNYILYPIAAMIIIYLFAVLFHIMKITAKEKTVQSQSGIKGFDKLLKTIELSDANVLAVAGNLLSLKTEKGIKLLKKYLEKDRDNKLKLIIPKDSKPYLKNIKDAIPNSVNQIEAFIYEPFWFLQGIVIIGKVRHDRTYIMHPIGCFYYKTKFSEKEDVSDEGIYIDLASLDPDNDYIESISAYYFLLNTLKYSQKPYEVENVFKNISDANNPIIYNPKIETIDWRRI